MTMMMMMMIPFASLRPVNTDAMEPFLCFKCAIQIHMTHFCKAEINIVQSVHQQQWHPPLSLSHCFPSSKCRGYYRTEFPSSSSELRSGYYRTNLPPSSFSSPPLIPPVCTLFIATCSSPCIRGDIMRLPPSETRRKALLCLRICGSVGEVTVGQNENEESGSVFSDVGNRFKLSRQVAVPHQWVTNKWIHMLVYLYAWILNPKLGL